MDITMVGLRKIYRGKVEALRGVDLEIGPGMFGLPVQRRGQDYLMRILAGILLPTSGTITVGGHDLRTESGAKR